MISHDLIPPGGRFPWGLSSTNSDSAKHLQNGFSDFADPIGVAAFRSSINLEHPKGYFPKWKFTYKKRRILIHALMVAPYHMLHRTTKAIVNTMQTLQNV